VPSFPDPGSNGRLPNPALQAFRAAKKACAKLQPAGLHSYGPRGLEGAPRHHEREDVEIGQFVGCSADDQDPSILMAAAPRPPHAAAARLNAGEFGLAPPLPMVM
jgi:hypothetical protein